MEPDNKVTYPDELLEKFNIEGVIFSEASKELGFATLSEIEGSAHILRIYQLLYNEYTDAFEFTQELAAFTSESRARLLDLNKRLPEIGGLEMLMLLNPSKQSEGLLN